MYDDEKAMLYRAIVIVSSQHCNIDIFIHALQARRQEFPEGGSSTRVAFTAGGLGAAQVPQKL